MADSPQDTGGVLAPPDKNARQDHVLEAATQFVELLEKMERRELAQLKRNAGEVLPGKGVAWFPSLLRSGVANKNKEIFFLVATLYDFNRKPKIGNDFGATLGIVAERSYPLEPPEKARKRFRRFHVLLDASFDTIVDPDDFDAPVQQGGGEMAFRLRQMVRICAAKEVGLDWPQLLADLCRWSLSDKRVQKKWARSFFGQYSGAAPDNAVPVEATDEPAA